MIQLLIFAIESFYQILAYNIIHLLLDMEGVKNSYPRIVALVVRASK